MQEYKITYMSSMDYPFDIYDDMISWILIVIETGLLEILLEKNPLLIVSFTMLNFQSWIRTGLPAASSYRFTAIIICSHDAGGRGGLLLK